MQKRKSIAIVIPAYNEATNIEPLLRQLTDVVADLPYSFRFVVVDDGSSDQTAEAARGVDIEQQVTVIRLSRNFGKETAILAGLDDVQENAAIIMDADLQHPAATLPEFIRLWEAGHLHVYAVKQNRRGEPVLNVMLGRLFYKIINSDSAMHIEPDALDFRLLDSQVINALRSMRERVRFTKGLYAWIGFPGHAVPIIPSKRRSGTSHFGGKALRKLGWDGLTSFSNFPLRMAATTGVVIAMLSMGYGFYIAMRTLLFGADVPGWATLAAGIMLLGGIQLFFLGMVGIYIRNIFEETKQRPLYFIASRQESTRHEHIGDAPKTTPRVRRRVPLVTHETAGREGIRQPAKSA